MRKPEDKLGYLKESLARKMTALGNDGEVKPPPVFLARTPNAHERPLAVFMNINLMPISVRRKRELTRKVELRNLNVPEAFPVVHAGARTSGSVLMTKRKEP